MVISFLVATGSAGFLYKALEDLSTVEVPLEQVKAPPKESMPQAKAPEPMDAEDKMTGDVKPDAQTTSEGTPQDKQEMMAKLEKGEKGPPLEKKEYRNILFSYHSSTAKEVFIVGDFNNWFRNPMMRKNKKTWTAAVKIEPGTYQYLFVVDGKRIGDPNASSTKDGKSVITVKSLKSKQ